MNGHYVMFELTRVALGYPKEVFPLLWEALWELDEDDSVVETISLQSFQQASRKETKNAGELVFKVTHGDIVLIDETTITLEAGVIYSVVLTGSYSSPDFLIVERPEGDVDDDESEEAEVKIINLSSAASLDVYLDTQIAVD